MTTNPTMTTTKTTKTMKDILSSWESSRMWSLLFLLAAVHPALSAYSWGQPSRDWRNPAEESQSPEFQVATSSIMALSGQTAYLPCRVRNLGDRVVSWIRTRDLHILTSGTLAFTADERFEVLHPPESEMWTLRIMSVQPRDQGKYECQVNTDPKINYAVLLTVTEADMKDSPALADHLDSLNTHAASAIIEGPHEQYVSRGTTVTFTCVVMSPYTANNRPPRIVDWFHGDRPVSIQAERGGISIETEKTELQTKSRLTVAGVTYRDAGNYTCRPADTFPATVQLIVVEGEHTEAMQRDGGPSGAPRTHQLSFLCQLVIFLCFLNAYHLCFPNSCHLPEIT